ncbi:MAG: hypothetical protein K1X65_12760 [Caldilineales bacterium]|nr:hypothetical protein [Caldilineales bacterium]MCW5861425.1 hypothetical protein [Caldilineales bacterium]
MSLTGSRTFVGLGFGAIQAGLFLYEAHRSGQFGRLVVAEVVPDIVASVRRAGGRVVVNIAHPDRVEQASLGPVAIENPAEEADRERLSDAIAAAAEIATAVPSIAFYATESPGSLHRVLAEGLRRKARDGGPRTVIYTAENHNHAAERLQEAVMAAIPAAEHEAVRAKARFLNTVIGKMSGVVTDPAEIRAFGLGVVTPDSPRTFLVEAFNRILISAIDFPAPPFTRGLTVFAEKPDLLPFEEAKLYGHNATHALAAYLGAMAGRARIAELRDLPGAMPFLRRAFIAESGAALCRKHAGLDPLFTEAGFAAYAEDLLERMTNPYLRDTVERVGRDPQRKLGWDDRLIGVMRLARGQGIAAHGYGVGAAAALAVLDRQTLTNPDLGRAQLAGLWQPGYGQPGWPQPSWPALDEQEAMQQLVEQGRRRLLAWVESGFSADL